MAGLTIGRKNFLASVARRKFGLLAAGRTACHCFLGCWWRTHRIKSAAGEISRVTPEVRAAKENRQSVDRNEPENGRTSGRDKMQIAQTDVSSTDEATNARADTRQ